MLCKYYVVSEPKFRSPWSHNTVFITASDVPWALASKLNNRLLACLAWDLGTTAKQLTIIPHTLTSYLPSVMVFWHVSGHTCLLALGRTVIVDEWLLPPSCYTCMLLQHKHVMPFSKETMWLSLPSAITVCNSIVCTTHSLLNAPDLRCQLGWSVGCLLPKVLDVPDC